MIYCSHHQEAQPEKCYAGTVGLQKVAATSLQEINSTEQRNTGQNVKTVILEKFFFFFKSNFSQNHFVKV